MLKSGRCNWIIVSAIEHSYLWAFCYWAMNTLYALYWWYIVWGKKWLYHSVCHCFLSLNTQMKAFEMLWYFSDQKSQLCLGQMSSPSSSGSRKSPAVPRMQTRTKTHRKILSITMATYFQSSFTWKRFRHIYNTHHFVNYDMSYREGLLPLSHGNGLIRMHSPPGLHSEASYSPLYTEHSRWPPSPPGTSGTRTPGLLPWSSNWSRDYSGPSRQRYLHWGPRDCPALRFLPRSPQGGWSPFGASIFPRSAGPWLALWSSCWLWRTLC